MAGPCACHSFYRNPPPAGEDELVRATSEAPTNDNGTPSHTSAVSYVSTPAPAPPLAPAKPVAKNTNANLQRATKLALELFVQGQ